MRFAALDDENSLTRPVSKRDERGGEGGGGQERDWQGGEAWRLDSGKRGEQGVCRGCVATREVRRRNLFLKGGPVTIEVGWNIEFTTFSLCFQYYSLVSSNLVLV